MLFCGLFVRLFSILQSRIGRETESDNDNGMDDDVPRLAEWYGYGREDRCPWMDVFPE